MSTTVPPVEAPGGDLLREFVERSLGAGPVLSLRRRPLEQATSYACEVLHARTPRGEHELLWKDLGRSLLPRPDAEAARRELWAYRELLPGAGLGTAPCHGARGTEDGPGGPWLLLAFVRGTRLDELPPAAWAPAAEWLARLQALAPPAGPLVEHDVAHYLETAARAARATEAVDQKLEHRLRPCLAGWEVLAFELAGGPRTLVHGSFDPRNLLLEPGTGSLVALDWKHVARGNPFHDLACLAERATPDETAELLDVHRRAAAERGVPLPDPRRARRAVCLLQMHGVLRSLGRAVDRPRETVEGLVERAELLAGAVRRLRGSTGVVVPGTAARDAVDHPALAAWRALGGDADPTRVEFLRGRYFGRRGRVLYRLPGAGPDGESLVAKRCTLDGGRRESRIYADVLPRLGVSVPGFHGWLEEERNGWLFLEDVGGAGTDPDPDDAHVQDAIREWLDAFHAAGRTIALPADLPDRGVDWCNAMLLAGREEIVAARELLTLGREARAELDRLLAVIERTFASWESVTRHGSEPTFVHGDFRQKNVFVRRHGARLEVLPVDWEYAGRGLPEIDHAALWPERSAGARHAAGVLMRMATAVRWAATGLPTSYPQRFLEDLAIYRERLEQALAELGLPA